MAKTPIPPSVKAEVEEIVERFNRKVIKREDCFYVPRYKGNCLYLDRWNYGVMSHVCRLTYKGKMDNWEFAVFKYSSETYDPDDWFFPGSDMVDGTVEGAMKAGLEAYP